MPDRHYQYPPGYFRKTHKKSVYPLWSAANLNIQLPCDPVSIEPLNHIGIEEPAALSGQSDVFILILDRDLILTRQLAVKTCLSHDLVAIHVASQIIEKVVHAISPG